MEESKVPEYFELQTQSNELQQLEYLFKKKIGNENVFALGISNLIVKNERHIACIQFKKNFIVTYINNNKRKKDLIYYGYNDLVECVMHTLYDQFE
tara:strand:- start:1698 stop:1985 length:288 start_codon:yes stop_codon:yes gene_type:complete